MRKIIRLIASVIYYGFARYLPVSYSPLSFGLTKPFRGMLCRLMVKKCGRNVNVERGADFGYNLEIGDNSGIGINASINTSGRVIIGKNVMMGRDVMIITRDHRHDDPTRPMIGTGYVNAPIIIEDDVWIGARAILLSGIRVGKASIIGAGAVVPKDMPPFTIVGGNPAKVLKQRNKPAEDNTPSTNIT